MPMHGGVARDGWNPLGIRRKKLLKEGVPGTALVTSFYVMDDESTIGLAQHEFTLEVRVDGREPYDVQGLFRIPVKLISSFDAGALVPVKVHPSEPDRVAIDWDAWDGSTEELAGRTGREPFAGTDATVASSGAPATGLPDATKQMMLDGWTAAVQGAQMSIADFEAALADSVEAGMITQAEADTARKAVG